MNSFFPPTFYGFSSNPRSLDADVPRLENTGTAVDRPRKTYGSPVWSIEFVPATGVVQVAMQGAFEGRHTYQVVRDAYAAALRFESDRLLVDAREMEPTRGLLMEFIGLPRIVSEMSAAGSIRTAIVHPSCPQKPQVFVGLETVYRNSGLPVRFFKDHKSAAIWIQGDARKTTLGSSGERMRRLRSSVCWVVLGAAHWRARISQVSGKNMGQSVSAL